MATHNELGKRGEDLACNYLLKSGYEILHRNWRIGRYELDIVALKDEMLIVIEVKTRLQVDYNYDDLITESKRKYLIRAANAYVNKNNLDLEVSFDLIVVSDNNKRIDHIKEAIRIFD